MFNTEFKQGLVAAIAALVFTATAVGAAVGPAQTVNGTTIFAAAAQLEVSARA